MTTKSITFALAFNAALAAAVAATAAPTFYTNEAAFLAAAPATTLESFETSQTYPAYSLTFGDITVTDPDTNPIYAGFNPTDGSKDLFINTSSLTFTRANPAAFTAFGINVVKDVGEGGNFDIATPGGSATYDIDATNQTSATVYFFGVIDPAGFTQVTLAPTLAGDLLEYDRLQSSTLSAGVPEPAAWATMLLGFGMAGSAIRRRRTLAVGC